MGLPLTMRSVTIPASADTLISYAAPTTNYGTAVGFQCTPLASSLCHALLSFNLLVGLPSVFTVVFAKLRLYTYAVFAARTIAAYRCLRTDWVETQATWNIYKTGSSWGTVGCLLAETDYTVTNVALSMAVANATWQEWDVTNQVNTAITTTSGIAHFFLKDIGTTATGDNAWRSRDYTDDATKRPQLVVYG